MLNKRPPISDSEINHNNEIFIDLLRNTGRNNVGYLIKFLCEETDFFVAPASAKYHLNIPGGLVYHSLSVYEMLCKLCDDIPIFIKDDTKIITSLLHDVCKTNTYVWNELEGKYERKDRLPIGHGDKSIMVIQQSGFQLTKQEMGMIRWHMAHYDESFRRNQNDIYREFPEAMLLYFADHISTLFLEEFD